MDNDQTDRFDSSFRPLVAAALGSGAMTIGVLDFTGSAWTGLSAPAQELVAASARVTFLVFGMTTGALLVAYVFRRALGTISRFVANLYGAMVFIGGAYLCGMQISQALLIDRPETAAPPDAALAFIGAAGAGFIGLGFIAAAIAVTKAVAAALPRRRPKIRERKL